MTDNKIFTVFIILNNKKMLIKAIQRVFVCVFERERERESARESERERERERDIHSVTSCKLLSVKFQCLGDFSKTTVVQK